MKQLCLILAFSPFMTFGQTVSSIALGEYTQPNLTTAGNIYSFSSNTNLIGISGGTSGIPKQITGTGTTFTFVGQTLHGGSAIDVSGIPWGWGNNTDGELGFGAALGTYNITQITADSRGVAFTGIKIIQGSYYQQGSNDIAGNFWVKQGSTSDTVFYAGVDEYGMGGDGSTGTTTYLTPQLMFVSPAGHHVVQMIGADAVAIRTDDGKVYTWGAGGAVGWLGRPVTGSNYATPIQVTIPNVGGSPDSIVQIVGGSDPGILYLGKSGNLYGNTNYSAYMGDVSNVPYNSPTDLTTNIETPIFSHGATSITQIGANSSGFYVIDNLGKMWFFGDTGMGTAGYGFEANMASPGGTSTPWFIDPSTHLVLQIYTPVQVTNKTNWTKVFSGCLFNFTAGAMDANNQLWMWGRNKGGVIPNGIIECPGDGGLLTANYPNSWDVINATPTNPYSVSTAFGQGCLGCVTGAVSTNCFNCRTVKTPVASATAVGTVLNGTSSSVASPNTIVRYIWSQVSGPNTAVIDARAAPVANLSGLTSGTYVFGLQVMDNGFDSATTTVSLVVGTQTGFYFSAAGSGTACTIGAPCGPSYINTVYASAVAGDTLYLNRGDVFPVELVCGSSGSAGNRIVMKPYGTGREPVVGGTDTLTGWTNIGTNLWSVSYTKVWPNLMIINGKLAPYATSPNYSNSMFIPSAMGTNTITDVTNAPNVKSGDTLIGRCASFVFNKRAVSSVISGTITVGAAFTYSGVGGLGWFKWGDKPDTIGEWRDTLSTIQIYHVGTPTEVYEVPLADTNLISSGTYQEFDSIHFKGASNANIILTFATVSNIVFNGDSVSYGFDGMQLRSEGALTVNNCHFLHMTDNALLKQNLNNYNNIFTRDSAYDIGMIRGMGGDGNASYFYSGFVVGDSGSVVKYCQVDSVGYHGIVNLGSGFVTDSSYVNWYCQTLVDGGAYYTWINTAPAFARQRLMRGNSASNGGGGLSANGCTNTISDQAFGFYLDSRSESVTLSGNTSNQTVSGGFFVHGASNTLTGNHSYGAGYADLLVSEVSGETITGLSIKHNGWYSGTTIIPAVRFTSINADINSFGTVDSNQVAGNVGTTTPYFTLQTGDAGTFRTPASWTSNTGYDTHSSFATGIPYFLTNQSGVSTSNLVSGGRIDLAGNKYSGSITLPAYNSLFLFGFSISIPLPRGNRIIIL